MKMTKSYKSHLLEKRNALKDDGQTTELVDSYLGRQWLPRRSSQSYLESFDKIVIAYHPARSKIIFCSIH